MKISNTDQIYPNTYSISQKAKTQLISVNNRRQETEIFYYCDEMLIFRNIFSYLYSINKTLDPNHLCHAKRKKNIVLNSLMN